MHQHAARFVVVALAALIGTLGVAGPGTDPGATTRLGFTDEVQNLRFAERSLQPADPLGPGTGCASLEGELRTGSIPHRTRDESTASTDNFIPFVIAYPTDDSSPRLLVDLARDGVDCGDEIPLLAHPHAGDRMFRTLNVTWKADTAPERSRRYRLTVPARNDVEPQTYWIDLIDVPVARWKSGANESLLVLHDGNHDGTFGRAAGDGVLVGKPDQGPIDISPHGANFRSYHGVLDGPGGRFEIRNIDARGRYLDLERVSRPESRALAIGDPVPSLECPGQEPGPITIGGARGRHQLVYFWMSACGGCDYDMSMLVPLLEEVPKGRIEAVGVSLDDDPDSFRSFVDSHSPDWPQCYAGLMLWDHPLSRRLDVQLPSTFVLLDPQGRLVARVNGVDDARELLEKHGLLPPQGAGASAAEPVVSSR